MIKCAKCGKETDKPLKVRHYKNRKTPMFICHDEKIPDILKWCYERTNKKGMGY